MVLMKDKERKILKNLNNFFLTDILQESIYDPHMGTDILTGLLSGEGGYYDSLKEEIKGWGTTDDVWNWME